jgi:hypothetical protein
MTQTGRRARVAHAIPGRLRIRLESEARDPELDGLGAVRFAPGVLAIETNPAARSTIIRYDPTATTESAILTALEQAGIELVSAAPGETSPPAGAASDAPTGGESGGGEHDRVEMGRIGAARDSLGRYLGQRGEATKQEPKGHQSDPKGGKDGERSALMEMLIGPPLKLDRRFAESLALSAVSLLTARQVGLALGGGTTLPAYFVIWFALRRLTGAGRRR